MSGLFVTGTDTGVGKTLVSAALLASLRSKGHIVQGMKPVASGCEMTADGLRNDDAQQLIDNSSLSLPYSVINPYAFEAAVAPHLVAAQTGVVIDIDVIRKNYQDIAAQCDWVVVEGAGGWQVPLNSQQTMADLAIALQLPIVLVVGMRLGCINHALLSYQSIRNAGLVCLGWVANEIDPNMQLVSENIDSIDRRLDAPLLARIPFSQHSDVVSIGDQMDIANYIAARKP